LFVYFFSLCVLPAGKKSTTVSRVGDELLGIFWAIPKVYLGFSSQRMQLDEQQSCFDCSFSEHCGGHDAMLLLCGTDRNCDANWKALDADQIHLRLCMHARLLHLISHRLCMHMLRYMLEPKSGASRRKKRASISRHDPSPCSRFPSHDREKPAKSKPVWNQQYRNALYFVHIRTKRRRMGIWHAHVTCMWYMLHMQIHT
jgi:hypothetical protein